jgi:citrate synthase
MPNDPDDWPTAITDVRPGQIAVRGYPIEELMDGVSFSDAVYLVFQGQLPSPAASRIFAAILVASVDHGGGSPSALTARTVASAGASACTAAAAGLLAISRHHGAVIEDCMHHLSAVTARVSQGESLDDAASSIVATERGAGRRMPGFGHRTHEVDPRPRRLFDICRAAGLADPAVEEAAWAIERAISKISGKPVPLNLDGAIACALLMLDFPPEAANPLFTVGRFVGLNAQALEEAARMRPMRVIHPRSYFYDGPPARHLDERR